MPCFLWGLDKFIKEAVKSLTSRTGCCPEREDLQVLAKERDDSNQYDVNTAENKPIT